MLSAIRERATGWIAWFIVGILTIPFAFWGINTYFEGLELVDVADVNGEAIDYRNYQRALQRRRQETGNANPELFADIAFKRGVLERLIEEELLAGDASDNGYRLSDRQLSERIRSVPDFRRDDVFDQDLYLRLLSNAGYSVAAFEELQRRQGGTSQLYRGLDSGGFALEEEVRRLVRLQLQERKARYVLVLPVRFLDETEVSDEEITEEYDRDPNLYTEAARIKVEYVEMSVAGIAAGIQPSGEEIESYYENNLDEFVVPATRQASHILIKPQQEEQEQAGDAEDVAAEDTEAGEDEEAPDADAVALEKARDLLRQIAGGADFAELAMQHSEDPGSARNGGDLGVVERGVMVKPFEEAVFAMDEIGALTEEPVKTSFGYHIIKLTDYTPETRQDLEEARPAVVETLATEQARDLFSERVETLRNLAFEQPDTLAPMVDELGLEIQQSDWFSEFRGEGVAASTRVREAAFGSEVLEEGLNSETIEVDPETLVVVRKLEYEAQRVRELDEVREDIKSDLIDRKAADKVREYGAAALARLRAAGEGEGDGESDVGDDDDGGDGDVSESSEEEASGDPWETLVKDLEAEAVDLPLRRDQGEPEQREILQAVFNAPRLAPGRAYYGGIGLGDGSYAVFALESVSDEIDMESEDVIAARESVRESLKRRHGSGYFGSLVEGIKGRASIKIYEQNL